MPEKLYHGPLTYLKYLRQVKHRSERTIKQYRYILRAFQRFEPVTHSSWQRFLEHLSKYSPKTQRLYLTTVKDYLNWKVDNGYLKVKDRFWNKVEPPKEKKLPRALTPSQVFLLINSARKQRDKAIIKLLANTGMRVGELANLKPEDVTIEGDWAYIRIRGKGNKERTIKIQREIIEEAINTGLFKKPLSVRTIQRIIKTAGERVGLRVTPHVLRHTFAVTLVEKGVPINKVQALLGHESLATTSIYLKIATENIEVPRLF